MPAAALDPAKLKLLINSAQGKDPTLDPVAAKVLEFLPLAAANWQTPPDPNESIDKAGWPLLGAAMIGWWKRARGTEMPTYATIRPYADAARYFVRLVGIPYLLNREMPWGTVDLESTRGIADVLASSLIDWKAVRDFLGNVPSGTIAKATLVNPSPSYQTVPEAWYDLQYDFDWKKVPWEGIPWASVPWQKLAVQEIRDAIARGDQAGATEAMIDALIFAYQLDELLLVDVDVLPPKDWDKDNDGAGGATAPPPPPAKKRDLADWLLIGASLITAAAIATGTAVALSKRKKK